MTPRRVEALTFEAPEVVVDMSRVHWDVATRHHLLDLARECRLTERRDAMLRGELVNGSKVGRCCTRRCARRVDKARSATKCMPCSTRC